MPGDIIAYEGVDDVPVEYFDSNSLIGAVGNRVMIWNLMTNGQRFTMTTATRGIATIASSGGLYAFAAKASDPRIEIHTEKGGCLATLQDPKLAEFRAIGISKDKTRIAALGGGDQNLIIVWKIESKSVIGTALLPSDFNKVSFCPTDSNWICATGPTVRFFKLENTVEKQIFREINGEFKDCIRDIIGHSWTIDENLSVLTKQGEIILIRPTTGEVISRRTLDLGESNHATAYVKASRFYVVGSSDGQVHWFDENESCAPTRKPAILSPNQPIQNIVVEGPLSSQIVVRCNGALYVIDDVGGSKVVVQRITDFHVGTVMGLCPIYSIPRVESMVASIGGDGSFRVWNVSESKCSLVHKTSLDDSMTPLTVLASHPNVPFVAVGTVDGDLHLTCTFRTHDDLTTLPIEKIHVFDRPMNYLAFSTLGDKLAVASQLDNNLCIFGISIAPDESGSRVKLLDVVELSSPPLSLSWNSDYLAVALNDEKTQHIQLVKVTLSETTVKTENMGALQNINPEMFGQMLMDPSKNQLLVSSANKLGCVDVFSGNLLNTEAPLTSKWAHSGYWCLANSICGHVAAGAPDSTISFWTEGSEMLAIRGSGIISCICFSCCGNYILAGNNHGGILSLRIPGRWKCRGDKPAPLAWEFTVEAENTTFVKDAGQSQIQIFHQQKLLEGRRLADVHCEKRRLQIENVKVRLHELIDANQHAPELEQLTREEFVVDIEGMNMIKDKYNTLAADLQHKLHDEMQTRLEQYNKLKAHFWDSMMVHDQSVYSMDKSWHVDNFVVPKISQTEESQINKVMRMRRIEILELRVTNEQRRIFHLAPSNMDWMVNAGMLKPSMELSDYKSCDTMDKGTGASDSVVGFSKSDASLNATSIATSDKLGIVDLLYNPVGLRSRVHIRNQLVLIKQLQREMMLMLNKGFQQLVSEKEDALERIRGKYERVNEILAELRRQAVETPVDHLVEEDAEHILKVSAEEIGVQKYISAAERERIAAAERERKQREAEQKNSMGARALDEMMNGTLEAKREATLAEKELVRPEWMDEIDYADMTPEQKAEFQEFATKLQEFNAAKDKYVKALELEMKKCQTEATEIMDSFDISLREFKSIKVNVLECILVQENYRFLLTHILTKKNELSAQALAITDVLELQRKRITNLKLDLSQVEDAIRMQKVTITRLRDEEKTHDKTCRTRLQEQAEILKNGQPLNQEELKTFMDLIKQKESKASKSLSPNSMMRSPMLGGMSPGGSSAIEASTGKIRERRGSMSLTRGSSQFMRRASRRMSSQAILGNDAQASLRKIEQMSIRDLEVDIEDPVRLKALEPLNPDFDWPELTEMELDQWELIQALRKKRILLELDSQDAVTKLETLQTHLEEVQKLKVVAEEIFEKQSKQAAVIDVMQQRLSHDVQMCVRIRQGNVEAYEKQAGHTAKPSSIHLIPRAVVDKENQSIIALSKVKIETMTKMKEFRKNINMMEWEHEYLEKQKIDLEEHYTDIHMLRVTKTLQEMISGNGSAQDHSEEIRQYEVQLQKMQGLNQERMDKLRKVIKKSTKKQQNLLKENDELESKIQALRQQVEMRDMVLQARGKKSVLDTSAESKKSAESSTVVGKMKKIVHLRQMTDHVKKQKDDIESLKRELEKLRARSFPMFPSSPSQHHSLVIASKK